jgi:phosphoribosylformylglycinamidine cyclo-ligase
VVAVASSGLHSNGYSLARRVLEDELGLSLDARLEEIGTTLGSALLAPTRIYARSVAALRAELGQDLHALCHVTGGGIVGNLPRVLPPNTLARVRLDHERPALFGLIARGGPVEEAEMRRSFNLGVGLCAVVSAGAAERAVAALQQAGERAWLAGDIAAADGEPRVEVAGD